MTSEPNLRSLEALRGLLAVYVLLGHARWLLWDGHFRWIQEAHPWWANALAYAGAGLRYGHEAVICFFVLSGFFIHYRWVSSGQFAVKDYAKRRAHRLIPPYALALLATMLLDTIGWVFFPSLYTAGTGDALLDDSFSRMTYSPASIWPALALLPGSMGRHFGTNGPLWSLGYEFVYYAIYPLWLWTRIRLGRWAYLVGCAVAIAISLAIPQAFVQAVFLMYPLWLAGAAMAEYMIGRRHAPKPGLFALCALAGFVGFHFAKAPYVVVPYLLFGVGIVAFAAGLPVAVLRLRWHRALEWLGVRSYTIYISHFPFLALVSAATFELIGRRPAHGWLALLAVFAALAWCNGLWWLGERRFLHARFRSDATGEVR